jgi:flagellar protein FlbD
MIELTRIDGTTFLVNPDLIEIVEATHDTHVTLTNGHKYVCTDAPATIVERIVEFRRATSATMRRIA